VNGDASVANQETPGVNVPRAKIHPHVVYTFWYVFPDFGCADPVWYCGTPAHRLIAGGVTGEPGNAPFFGVLTPSEAFKLDQKFDDGLPAQGKWITPGRLYNRQDGLPVTGHDDNWSCGDNDNETLARYRVTEWHPTCSFFIETTVQ
jgi:hypothetical protein